MLRVEFPYLPVSYPKRNRNPFSSFKSVPTLKLSIILREQTACAIMSAKDVAEVIVLSDDSSDGLTSRMRSKRPHPEPSQLSSPSVPPDYNVDDDDIQIMVVTHRRPRQERTSAQQTANSSPTDLECVGERRGIVALQDYPHFRFQCGIHPFKKVRARAKETHCERCFCYVCDVLASECTKWGTHCKATDTVTKHRRDREIRLDERKRREKSADSARRTFLQSFKTPQRVSLQSGHTEPQAQLPQGEEELQDDGCAHSGSDENGNLPADFDHSHIMSELRRIRIDGKGSYLERAVGKIADVPTCITAFRGEAAVLELL